LLCDTFLLLLLCEEDLYQTCGVQINYIETEEGEKITSRWFGFGEST